MTTENNGRKIFTVLCIDGGGIRGIVPARILEEIETRTGKQICELFDMVGGPSTGAIVAAGLCLSDEKDPTKPKFTAREMKEFYFKYSPKIFPNKSFKTLRQLGRGGLYDPKPLEDALQTAYGDAKVRDSRISLLIPTTDIKNFSPVWVNHINGHKDESPENWSSMLMRDAVRAATTAPTFFPCKYYMTTPDDNMPNITHRHALIDGGFYAGTVLHRLLAQAKRVAPPDADIVMVHVGTGSAANTLSPEEYNKLGPLGLMSQAKGSILLSLVVSMTVRDAAMSIKDDIGDKFFTFDGKIPLVKTPTSPTISMDDASTENMLNLEKFAEQIIAENSDDFTHICNLLVNRHTSLHDFKLSEERCLKLIDILTLQPNARKTAKAYEKMTNAMNGVVFEQSTVEDKIILECAPHLLPAHRKQLSDVYQQTTENSGIKGLFKKAADVGRDTLKSIFKPAANDDQPSSTDAKKPKKPFWKP